MFNQIKNKKKGFRLVGKVKDNKPTPLSLHPRNLFPRLTSAHEVFNIALFPYR